MKAIMAPPQQGRCSGGPLNQSVDPIFASEPADGSRRVARPIDDRRDVPHLWEAVLARAVLDELAEPICCVDAAARVRHANLAFSAELRSGNLVSHRHGKLSFVGARTREVMRAVRACCDIETRHDDEFSPAGRSLALRGRDGTPAFVTVAPLARSTLHARVGAPCALLRIDAFNAPAPARIAQALNLTAAEANLVAALCQGGPLAAAAASLGISPNTAKSQLAAVFGKAGVARQSELIALVSALPR